MRYFHSLILSLILLLQSSGIYAQQSDTLPEHKLFLKSKTFKTLAVPVLFAGAGLYTLGDHGFYSSHDAARDAQKKFPAFHTRIDDYLLYAPGAAAFGLHLAGLKGKHDFKGKTLIYLTTNGLTGFTSSVLKTTIRYQRPDGSTYNSLPSGHTAFAFANAEFLHQEYKNESVWISVGGYTVAASVGAMRMLNNRHWMSDVFFGAGIGILSAKTANLLYPLMERELASITGLVAVPTYSEGKIGFAMVYKLK